MLQPLGMPLLAIVGGKDVLLDSDGTRRRLEQNVPWAELRYLPEAGHAVVGQGELIRDFAALVANQGDRLDRKLSSLGDKMRFLWWC